VWITPHSTERFSSLIGSDDQVGTFVLFEGRPCGGESDAAIVSAAWDFDSINSRYKMYLSILSSFPGHQLKSAADAKDLRDWAAKENQAWKAAVSMDPLLPKSLLPRGYLGQKAWKKRVSTLAKAGQLITEYRIIY